MEVQPGRFTRWVAITPSDSVDLAERPQAVYVGVAGNIVALMGNQQTITVAVIAGAIVPISPVRINSGSTTASGLFALYEV